MRRVGKKVSKNRASDFISILAFDPDANIFLSDDNCLGFGFSCLPYSAADPSTLAPIQTLLNENFPTGTIVQFVLYASPDIREQMLDLKALRVGRGCSLTDAIVDKQVNFLTRGTRAPLTGRSALKVRDFQLYVTVKTPYSGTHPSDHEFGEAAKLRLSIEAGLVNAQLAPRPLTDDDIVHCLNVIINQGEHAAWRTGLITNDRKRPIKEQVFDYDTAVKVAKNGLTLGSTHVSVLSPKRFPPTMYFGGAASMINNISTGTRGIFDTFMLCASVHYPDSQSTQAAMLRKFQMTVQQAFGPIVRFIPEIGNKKNDLEELTTSYEAGSRPVNVSLSLTLFNKSEDEATAAIGNARNYWTELGFELLPDTYIASAVFFNSLPFGSDKTAMRDLHRYHPMATKHAVPLLPLFAAWKGTGTPSLQLVARSGQLQSICLFDSSANYNACVVAQSGSGKSFLSNDIITAYLAQGAQIWVIDVGRSYLNVCHQLGGEFIEFGETSNVSLNPFPMIEDYEEEADVIVGLIIAMATISESLTNIQVSTVRKTIKDVWDEYGKETTIDLIASQLEAHDDSRIKDVGRQLWSFTRNGEYGRYFTGENPIEFKNRFTVLELEELKGRKQLQKAVLLLLIMKIQNTMYLEKNRGSRKRIVIMDEAWDLLSSTEVAQFIEHGFRRFRKYGGSAIVVTQGLTELYASASGRAIVENSTFQFILGMKSEVLDQVRADRRLPLTDFGYEQMKTVHTDKGNYSEIMCITPAGAAIGRLFVDKFRYLMFSTHPDDVAAIKKKKVDFPHLEHHEAIKEVIKDRGWNNE